MNGRDSTKPIRVQKKCQERNSKYPITSLKYVPKKSGSFVLFGFSLYPGNTKKKKKGVFLYFKIIININVIV